jgi:hypothetical protein
MDKISVSVPYFFAVREGVVGNAERVGFFDSVNQE